MKTDEEIIDQSDYKLISAGRDRILNLMQLARDDEGDRIQEEITDAFKKGEQMERAKWKDAIERDTFCCIGGKGGSMRDYVICREKLKAEGIVL